MINSKIKIKLIYYYNRYNEKLKILILFKINIFVIIADSKILKVTDMNVLYVMIMIYANNVNKILFMNIQWYNIKKIKFKNSKKMIKNRQLSIYLIIN